MSKADIERLTKEQEEFLKEFRTTTLDGFPTFDLDKYYNSLHTVELEKMYFDNEAYRKKHPNIGTVLYANFSEYLAKLIHARLDMEWQESIVLLDAISKQLSAMHAKKPMRDWDEAEHQTAKNHRAACYNIGSERYNILARRRKLKHGSSTH